MKLPITAKHLRDGKKAKCRGCPIALALVDMGFDEAFVGVETIYATKNHHSQYFKHSQQSRIFMSHFDRGLTVIPQTVELLEQGD